MSSGDHLNIQPPELKFPVHSKEHVRKYMLLTNIKAQHVVFSVKVSTPKWFCIRPTTGVLMPRSTCIITVTMQPQKNANCDNLVVQSAVTPDNGENIAPMFDQMKGKIAQKLVKISFYGVTTPVPISLERYEKKFSTAEVAAVDKCDCIQAVMFGSCSGRGYLTASEDGSSVVLHGKNKSGTQIWVVQQFGKGIVLSYECQLWSIHKKVLSVAKEGQMVCQLPFRVPNSPGSGWTIISCSGEPLVVLLKAEHQGHNFYLGVDTKGSLSLFEEQSVGISDRFIQWTVKTVKVRINPDQGKLHANPHVKSNTEIPVGVAEEQNGFRRSPNKDQERIPNDGSSQGGGGLQYLSCNTGHNINIGGTQNNEGAVIYFIEQLENLYLNYEIER